MYRIDQTKMTKTDAKSTNKKKTAAKAASSASKIKITPKEQEILNAISTLKARSGGTGSVDRDMVYKLVGYNKSKGAKAFANAITILRKHKGLIVFDSKTMDLTDTGEPLAAPVSTLPSRNQELDKAVAGLKKGGKKAKDMMDLLRDGEIHSRVSTAQALGYADVKKKGFVNLMSIVKSGDLIQYVKDSDGNPGLQLSDWLLEME